VDGKQVAERLEGYREELQALGVRYLALSGSAARGQARPDSDLDMLVNSPGLWACSSLCV
jgi:predicted nucleotidyltransferase